jgi:subtilisin-like proprotein convertase family protein
VTQSGTVGSVKIGVDIAHPYIGDLRVVLTAPGGTAVVLHDRSGAGADDLVRNYDAITTPALANLAGLPVQGQWRLAVADLAGQDLGQLRRWSLEIAVGTGTTVRRERTPALAIPDNDAAGITDTAEVAETGAVRSLKVWVDITHPYIGDLRVQLVAPSGRTVSLHDRSGGSRDNLIKTYDAAALPALQGFAGESLQGAWRLRVSDLAGRDVGKLNRWGFEVVV